MLHLVYSKLFWLKLASSLPSFLNFCWRKLRNLISFIPLIGNEYATTIKNEEEEAGYDNKNGKYATIKEGSKNKHATNQEIDQEDIGVPNDDDDNLQITSKLNLTEKFEATSPSSAWVGSTIEPMIEKSCEEIKKADINLRTTLRYEFT